MPHIRCSVLLLLILMSLCSVAQQEPGTGMDRAISLPGKFLGAVNRKISTLDKQLTRQTEKYLQRLAKREQRLQRKLSRLDSAAAKKLFDKSNASYADLADKIKNPPAIHSIKGTYLPHADSLNSMLNFLTQNNELFQKSGALKDKLQNSYGQLQQLQSKMAVADKAKEFVRQRKQQMKEALGKYTRLPKSITKGMDGFKKEAYYYGQQIREYKELLNDPDKLEKKALSLLTKIPAFQNFMKEHGQLTGLFSIPGNYASVQSVTGLQTRNQVQQMIQGRLAAGGPGAQNVLQQSLQQAQTQLNKLKDKISKLGNGSGDMEMPDFKPNNQKTKSFWKRLEYGTNLQSTKSNYFFPTTTDLGLSVGYKLSDKSVIGIGASYKIGFGKDIRHIVVTNEGMGLRSFLDIKLKGSFYCSAGYERNYQPVTISPSTGGGQGEAWNQSGLIGISKVLAISSPNRGRSGGGFFKKTKLQLLWDFMSYQQVPRGQAVKFRVGYNF